MTDTRQRLLEGVRACLAHKGLVGTTSRDIARTAGANLAAITYYFGSKEALIATALLQGLRDWLSPTLEILARPGDPADRMLGAVRSLTTTFEAHRSDAPLYLEALVQAPRIGELQDGLRELWAELRELLVSQISGMQAAGALPSWIDAEAMASLLIGVANGLVLQVSLDPTGPGLEAMAGQLTALLLAAQS